MKTIIGLAIGAFGFFLLLASMDINHGGLALLVYITGGLLTLLGLSVAAMPARTPIAPAPPARFPRLKGKSKLPENVQAYLSQMK